MGKVPACTIAVKKDVDGFKFGIAICSKHDNFSRKLGREVAENRLNQGFGLMKMKKVPDNFNSLTDSEQCLAQLYTLVVSVVKKNRKWKKRITKFNLEQKTPKITLSYGVTESK
jgi:hypothetical protein